MAAEIAERGFARRPVGVSAGLTAAVLFGLSTPASKQLLADISPLMLAGLLYAGAALALWIAMLARPRTRRVDAGLRRTDLPKLTIVVVCGGIAAPIALLSGLSQVSAAAGSLLTNLEGPFTLLLALLVFGEHMTGRALLGALAIFAGATALGAGGANGSSELFGIALIAVACLLWALDNNVTQLLTLRDPLQIVVVKATVAAIVNVTLALIIEGWSGVSLWILGIALVVGAGAYGISILLDAIALRHLGAAREAAIFSLAPFIGFVISLLIFGVTINAFTISALAAMIIGSGLLLTEKHDHIHTHKPLTHEHAHAHDEHHQHQHSSQDPELDAERKAHNHVHTHTGLTHRHTHTSDVHHKH